MAQRGKLSTRAHRAGDPTRSFFCCVVGRYAFGELRGEYVHVVRFVGDVVLGEVDGRSVERVGLNHVAADIEETGVDLLDSVGPRDEQILVAAFEAWSTKIVERKVLDLKIGTHRAVEDDDAFF